MTLGSVRTVIEAHNKSHKKLPYLMDYRRFELKPGLTEVGSEVGPGGINPGTWGILPQHCIIDNTGDAVTVTPYPQAKVMLCY